MYVASNGIIMTRVLCCAQGKLFEKKDPLTHRETLVILERIFDIIMELDRLKEDQPPPESEAELQERYVE